MLRRLATASALLATLYCLQAESLGLGDMVVGSRLNEPFLATIPMTPLSEDEADNISVRLASSSEFEKAGMERGEFLSSLRFKVVGSEIKVSSDRIAREPLLAMLVEVRAGGSRVLRDYTVLLDLPPGVAPDTATVPMTPADEATVAAAGLATPAPVPTAAPGPAASAPATIGGDATAAIPPPADYAAAPAATGTAPAPVADATSPPAAPATDPAFGDSAGAPAASPASPLPPIAARGPTTTRPGPAPVRATASRAVDADGRFGPVKSGETFWAIAERVNPDPALNMNQVMLALYNANPQAFSGGINGLRIGAMLDVPSAEAIARVRPTEAQRRLLALRAGRPDPGPLAAAGAARPEAGRRPDPPVFAASPPPSAEPATPPAAAPVSPRESSTTKAEGSTGSPSAGASALGASTSTVTSTDASSTAASSSTTTPETATSAETAATPAAESVAPAAESAATTATTAGPDAAAAAISSTAPSAESAATPTVAPAAASTATAAPVAAAATPAPAKGSFLEGEVLGFPVLWLLVAGVVLLLLILLLARRRRDSGDVIVDTTAPVLVRAPNPARAPAPAAAAVPAAGPVVTPPATEGAGGASAEPSASPLFLQDEAAAEPSTAKAAAMSSNGSVIDLDLAAEGGSVLDAQDPLAEADFHLSYGLYDEAVRGLVAAVGRQPARRDLPLKLAETFFAAGRPAEFEALAVGLRREASPAEWSRLAFMGAQLCPDSTLFRDGESADPATTASAAGAAVGAFGAASTFGEPESVDDPVLLPPLLDLPPDPVGAPPVEPEPVRDGHLLEFELRPFDAAAAEAAHDDAPGPEADAFEAQLREQFQSQAQSSFNGDAPRVHHGDDDLGLSPEFETQVASDASAADYDRPLIVDEPALESDFQPLSPESSMAAHEAPSAAGAPRWTTEPALDLSAPPMSNDEIKLLDIDAMDLPPFDAEAIEPEPESDISTSDVVGTKLDLARAYVDMGDNNSARELLMEVASEGQGEQQAEAERLLQRLPL